MSEVWEHDIVLSQDAYNTLGEVSIVMNSTLWNQIWFRKAKSFS